MQSKETRPTADARIGFFDRLASEWDTSEQDPAETVRAVEQCAERLNLCAGDCLLEVGCGTGQLTEWLVDRVRPGRVTALDFSPEMLRKAAAKGIDAEFLPADGTLSQEDADARLAEIECRAAVLREEAVGKIDSAELRNAPVLCSGHQAGFCRWLGLRVAAEFPGVEATCTGRLNRAVRDADAAGVRLIVANEPEGRRAADALADRLNARVVVFANFPESGIQHAFDAMVRRNLSALTAATEQL